MSEELSFIGRYKIIEELGQGAMGVVYLAEDPILKRRVAIKVVHSGTAAQAEALRRFQLEAEISARLNHPNIITIFDVGEQPGVGPFLAMEYIEGMSLFERLYAGPMSNEEAMLLLIQAMQALEAAHAKGIVHRDFKPGNLMIASDGRLKLMDFGIARDRFEGTTTDLLCTPSFAAPELLDRQMPNLETDRWAFVVTAFRMLLGDLPFQAPSLSALIKVIDRDPPQFPEGTSPAIKEVFLKALAKSPDERYVDLRRFLMALLDVLPLTEEAHHHCAALLKAGDLLSRVGTFLLPGGTIHPLLRPSRLLPLLGGVLAVFVIGFWSYPRLFPKHLNIQSFPPGAQVFIDDKPLGVTPILDAHIRRDARVLRLEKKGYQLLEHAITSDDHVLMLSLMPEALRVTLRSEPDGADVVLDGMSVGQTPMVGLEIAGGGSHRLMIHKPGYEPWSMSVSRDHRPPYMVHLKKIEEAPFWKRWFKRPQE